MKFLWLVPWLLVTATAWADIQVPATVAPGKKIVAVVSPEVPPGAEWKGKFSVPGCDTELRADGALLIWADEGKHTLEWRGGWMTFEIVEIVQTDGTVKKVKSVLDWDSLYEVAEFTVTGDPDPQPIVNPYKPAPAYQAAAQPVKAFSLSNPDSQALAGMYATVAGQSRAGAYKSLGEVRADLVKRGQLLNLKGKYPRLPQAVEQYLAGSLGLEEGAPPATAGDVFETLAWAVFETGRAGR